jgi:hypothetical protein
MPHLERRWHCARLLQGYFLESGLLVQGKRHKPADDNEADAICLAYWTIEQAA